MLWWAAVFCSVLYCVAVRCGARCSVLQCVAVCCSVLPCAVDVTDHSGVDHGAAAEGARNTTSVISGFHI